MEIAKRYARLYGVSSYQNRSGIPDLPVARANVDVLKNALPHWGFIVDPTHNPVQTQIEEDLKDCVRDVSGDDVFLLYLTGHSFQGQDSRDVYFATRSTYDRDDIERQGYSLEAILRDLGKIAAKLKVLILDSCFSGAAAHLPETLELGSARSSVAVLTSSRRIGQSYVAGGEPLSHYTGAIVDCLGGFVRSGVDPVSLSMLTEAVGRDMRARTTDQSPEHLLHGDSGLALLKRSPPPPPPWGYGNGFRAAAADTARPTHLAEPVDLPIVASRVTGEDLAHFRATLAARTRSEPRVMRPGEQSSMLDAVPGPPGDHGPKGTTDPEQEARAT